MNKEGENSINNIYSNVLFVADLPNEVINKDLEILFSKYQFIQASLNNSKSNNIWANVVLENEDCATKARHELNGYFLIPKSSNNDKSKGKAIRICKYESKLTFNNQEKTSKNFDFNRNLLIKNLDIKMSQCEFYNIFLKYGDISSGKIEYDKNGISKGFGYIYYYDKESAEKAKNELNNKEFYGKKIQIVNLIPTKSKKFNNNVTIFILNLPSNVNKEEIKSIFGKYGKIIDISLTDKGYAFIKYNSIEEATACIYDIKNHPICFSGLSNLVVKLAKTKEEREANKYLNNKLQNNEDICKIYFKYINNEKIDDIYDLGKKIILFIKIILLTEYNPNSVKINEKTKCGIVTFNCIKDVEIFINKFNEYCISRRPMFDCLPYIKIKNKINDEFIDLNDYTNLYPNNNDRKYEQKLNHEEFDKNNNKVRNSNFNNNHTKNEPLSNDVLYRNKNNYKNIFSNYSPINIINEPKNQSCQQLNYYKNNNSFYNSIDINHFNKNGNNTDLNNLDNNNSHGPNNNFKLNNKDLKLDNIQKEKNISKPENNTILLKPSEFNSSPKCIYNADTKKDENIEENIIDISDSIYQIVYDKHSQEAGKITGMIKELGFKKMNLLLSKPEELDKIIEKAYNMILESKKNK